MLLNVLHCLRQALSHLRESAMLHQKSYKIKYLGLLLSLFSQVQPVNFQQQQLKYRLCTRIAELEAKAVFSLPDPERHARIASQAGAKPYADC